MKSRAARVKHHQTPHKPRVFVTPGLAQTSPGGVYTASGRPVALPTHPIGEVEEEEVELAGIPDELDDWVPEPESYLSSDEAYDITEDTSQPELEEVVESDEVYEEGIEAPEPDMGVSSPVNPPGNATGGGLLSEPYVGERPIEEAIPVRAAQSTLVRWRRK